MFLRTTIFIIVIFWERRAQAEINAKVDSTRLDLALIHAKLVELTNLVAENLK